MQNLPQNHLEDLAEARALVCCGDFDALEMLYEDVPDTLSQLIRTAFVPRTDAKFIVSDFSAIEARVIAWLAGEQWRQDVFAKGGDIYCASASQMFKVPVEKHGVNGHLRQKGKIAELALGYGGSVGALKAMGALEMGLAEDELPPLVDAWRQSNPHIVKFWWDVDRAAMEAVRHKHTNETHGIVFTCRSGMLFITLPSGRQLAYVKPRIGENKFGGSCITYEGVGGTKKWERLDSYGPKFVENIVQATARDILCYAMQTLRCCSIQLNLQEILRLAEVEDFFVGNNTKPWKLRFEPDVTILDGIKRVISLIDGWKIDETANGVIGVAAATDARFDQPAVFSFERDKSCWSYNVEYDDSEAVSKVCVTCSEPENTVYATVPRSKWWSQPSHRTTYVTAADGATLVEITALAEELAQAIAISGRQESFVGVFTPQLTLGDEVRIINGPKTETIGTVTDVTHNFGRDAVRHRKHGKLFLNRHLRFNIAGVIFFERRPLVRRVVRVIAGALAVGFCRRTGLAEVFNEVFALSELLLIQFKHRTDTFQ